jgi:hypothetical protein
LSKKKLQEKKKQRREEVAKQRVLRRRKYLQDYKKRERELVEKQAAAFKGIPIKGAINERDAEIEAKIRHNLEILKSLEEAHLKETAGRQERNETLEAEGHLTLREKMEAIHVKAKDKLNVTESIDVSGDDGGDASETVPVCE